MSKRKDVDYAWACMTPIDLEIDAETDEMLRTAWELGRIAGIREAAILAGERLGNWTFSDGIGYVLRTNARKLKRRLK